MGASSEIKEPFSDDIFQQDMFNPSQKQNLSKFQRHVLLSCSQRKYIDNVALEAEKVANTASEKANVVSKQVNRANRQAKKAKKKVTSIYSEFIAILGIFTALSFALNGSFQILGTLFKDIKHPKSGSIGYSFVIGGLYLLIIYIVIVVLFEGMSKIVDEEAHYEISKPLWVTISIFSVVMMVIGLIALTIT